MAKTNIKKNAKGYGYTYTDLAQVHEYLEENSATYYQYIETIDGTDYVMTVPIIDGEEKAPRRGCRVVQATLSGKSNPAQEQGSALTYARRYSLLMAFGLATTDDDAQMLTRKQYEAVKEEKKVFEAKAYIEKMAIKTKTDMNQMLTYYGVSKIEDMDDETIDKCCKMLERKALSQKGL